MIRRPIVRGLLFLLGVCIAWSMLALLPGGVL